jgi:hypothetical protein
MSSSGMSSSGVSPPSSRPVRKNTPSEKP